MYGKVMVPLDGSKLAECVLPHVRGLAQGNKVKSILFVRVVEPIHQSMGGEFILSEDETKRLTAAHRKNAEEYLQKIAKRFQMRGVKVEWKVLLGRIAETLSDYATTKKMNLIVIATHGRSGVSRWVWGSVANRFLQSTCVPTLMIRPPECKPSW